MFETPLVAVSDREGEREGRSQETTSARATTRFLGGGSGGTRELLSRGPGHFSDFGEVLLFFCFRLPAICCPTAIVACALLATGCAAEQTKPAKGSVAFGIDDFGDTIRLAAAPTRIVSLNPTTTEILFAIGAGTRLIGRSSYDGWPAEARQVADLGPGIKPNVEAIIAARPDLVLLYASADNRPAAERLRAAGVATASFKVDSIAEFDRLTRLLGRLVGDSARGALVADTVKRTLDSVRAMMQDAPRVTVVIPAWHEPLMVIGGGSFMSQLVEIAGGQNVYADLAAPSPTVSFEDVLKRNPQFVLVGPESGARIRAQSKWRALPAVRNNRLIILDTSTVLRPATRLGEGAVSLAKQLHPQRIR